MSLETQFSDVRINKPLVTFSINKREESPESTVEKKNAF